MVVVCFNQGEVKDNKYEFVLYHENIRDVCIVFLKYELLLMLRAPLLFFTLKHFLVYTASASFTQT